MAKKMRSVWAVSIFVFLTIGVGRRIYINNPTILTDITSCMLYPFLLLHAKTVEPFKAWRAQSNQIHNVAELQDTYLKKIEKLEAENIQLKAEQHLMNAIQELDEFRKQYAPHGTIARVLRREVTPQHHVITLDKGERDGIAVDMVALSQNCLVGRVERVYPWYCEVRLVTDKRCKVAALCTTTGAQGIHYGSNKTEETELVHVSHLEPVKDGDTIVSSGAGMVFPYGFGLGRIEKIATSDLHHTIAVKPFLDPERLEYCVVMAKSQT